MHRCGLVYGSLSPHHQELLEALQVREKKLVAKIKRTAKTGNEQMSPAKQTEEATEELTNQLSISPRGRIAGKTTEDANRMKRKRETFNAPCIMDEALRVRASSLLLHTMDRVSSLYDETEEENL
ncbi:unnamed protein product [Camellia sinensis]